MVDENKKYKEEIVRLQQENEQDKKELARLQQENEQLNSSKNSFLLTSSILGVVLVAILFIPLFLILKSKKQNPVQVVTGGGCPRCGSAVDLSKEKCPNCGTHF